MNTVGLSRGLLDEFSYVIHSLSMLTEQGQLDAFFSSTWLVLILW